MVTDRERQPAQWLIASTVQPAPGDLRKRGKALASRGALADFFF
jgi:hypothetical protein